MRQAHPPSAQDSRPHIVGIGGSLAPSSTSLTALKVALEGAARAGGRTSLFDLRELDLPMYRPGSDVYPESVEHLANAVRDAAGLIWSSPLYHGSVSGSFKNAFDWLDTLGSHHPPYLTDKVIGMIAVAGGVHALQAVNTMEFMVRSLRAVAVPYVVTIQRANEVFDGAARLVDASTAESLDTLGREVLRLCATTQDTAADNKKAFSPLSAVDGTPALATHIG